MAEYDGTIHEGHTAGVLKKKHEKARRNEKEAKWPSYRNYFKARAILLEELSQPPDGWCETCGGKGYSLNWGTKDAKGETWHCLTEQDAKKIPCPDCTNVPG